MSFPIALALSGGGVRAMAFHAGVLRYLAEQNSLERVSRISTVSGGSLLVGLLMKEAGYAWPSSVSYLEHVEHKIKAVLTGHSLQAYALLALRHPCNFRYLLSRANLIAQAIEKRWEIDASLGALPRTPEWSINATTAENGKRFRFKADTLGDYSIGYASSEQFPLAHAMAVSAAFPGGIGPLVIDAQKLTWNKRPEWNAEGPMVVESRFHRLHLWDGGVYDNLGLEPFFDAGTTKPKHQNLAILVSDAGAALEEGFSYWALSPFRFKRVADIMSEQARALRVRGFTRYLLEGGRGAYMRIGTDVGHYVTREGQRNAFESTEWLSATESKRAACYPTTLRRLTSEEFELISRHGYETARAVQYVYPYL